MKVVYEITNKNFNLVAAAFTQFNNYFTLKVKTFVSINKINKILQKQSIIEPKNNQ